MSDVLTRPDAHRQVAFIADRQLHQHMRQFGIGKFGASQLGLLAEHAHPGQARELNRKRADANQDDAKGKLKELGKTVHGDRSGPHKARFLWPPTGHCGPFGPFAR